MRFGVVSFIWLGGKSNLIECTHCWNRVNKWCAQWTLSTEKITISTSHKSIYLMAKCTWSSVFFLPPMETVHTRKYLVHLVMAYAYFEYQQQHAWYINNSILNQYRHFPFILRQPARFFTSFSCSKSFWVVFQSCRKQFAFQLKRNRNVFFLLLKNRYVFLPTKKIVWNNQMLMIKLSLAYLHWCF